MMQRLTGFVLDGCFLPKLGLTIITLVVVSGRVVPSAPNAKPCTNMLEGG